MPGVTGVIGDDLAAAARQALKIDRSKIRRKAEEYSWERASRLFLKNIESALFAKQGRHLPHHAREVVNHPH